MRRSSVRIPSLALAALTLAPLATSPAAAQTRRLLYATAATPGRIYAYHLGDGGVLTTQPVVERETGGTNPSLMMVWPWPTDDGTSLGRVLYVRETDRVEAYAIGCDGRLGDRLWDSGHRIGFGVRGMAMSTNQQKLYVADRRRDRILAYDVRTPDDGIEPACAFAPDCDPEAGVPCCGVPDDTAFSSCLRGPVQVGWEDMLLRTSVEGEEVLYVSATSTFVNDRIYTFTLDENGDFVEPEPPKDDGTDSATTVACCGPNAVGDATNPCCDPTDPESPCCDPTDPIVIDEGGCIENVTTTTSTSTTTTLMPNGTTTTTEPECVNCRLPQKKLRKKDGERPAVARIRLAGALAFGPNQVPADMRAALGIDATGDVIYCASRGRERIVGFGFTDNGVLTQQRLSRTRSIDRYVGLTFSPGAPGDPGHVFGTVFGDGRVDDYPLDAKDRDLSGNPRVGGFIRRRPATRTPKDLNKSPVRMAVDDPVAPTTLYVAAGLVNRVEAYRLDSRGALASREPFSRTDSIRNAFPNEVVVTTVDRCP